MPAIRFSHCQVQNQIISQHRRIIARRKCLGWTHCRHVIFLGTRFSSNSEAEQDNSYSYEITSLYHKRQVFLEARASRHKRTALHGSIRLEDIDTETRLVDTLLRLGSNTRATTADTRSTAMHLSCRFRVCEATIEALLQQGRGTADMLDHNQQTPLHIMCCHGKNISVLDTLVRKLLHHMNTAPGESCLLLDSFGMTPLVWLAMTKPPNSNTLTTLFRLLKQCSASLSSLTEFGTETTQLEHAHHPVLFVEAMLG